MSNLVDDFINGTKEIPEDESKAVKVIITYFPLCEDVVSLPVQAIIDMTPEDRLNVFKEFVDNIKSVCNMFNIVAHANDATVINDVKAKIMPFAKTIGIDTEYQIENKGVEICCILAQVYSYLTEMVHYISTEYNVSYDSESNTVVDVSDAEDVEDVEPETIDLRTLAGLRDAIEKHAQTTEEISEDDHFTDMLAAEMLGATDGEPMTDEEMYGNK